MAKPHPTVGWGRIRAAAAFAATHLYPDSVADPYRVAFTVVVAPTVTVTGVTVTSARPV